MRHALVGHEVETAYERGWSVLGNGDLIAAAQASGFEALVTTDKNLRYQQNIGGRTLGIVVLPTTSWPRLKVVLPAIRAALEGARAGQYHEVRADDTG